MTYGRAWPRDPRWPVCCPSFLSFRIYNEEYSRRLWDVRPCRPYRLLDPRCSIPKLCVAPNTDTRHDNARPTTVVVRERLSRSRKSRGRRRSREPVQPPEWYLGFWVFLLKFWLSTKILINLHPTCDVMHVDVQTWLRNLLKFCKVFQNFSCELKFW